MSLVTDVVLPLALAFIMFALGLGLTGADFARVLRDKRDVGVGALCQILLLPAVAFALVMVWPLTPALAFGVMLIAVAPGGPTSNLLTAYARGDVALSITLTAVISLVGVVTIPLVLGLVAGPILGAWTDQDLPLARLGVSVVVLVAVPVGLGMLLRRLAPGVAGRLARPADRVAGALFVLVLAGAIWQGRNDIIPFFAQAGAVTLCLNVIMMALAWMIAGRLASGPRQRIAITLECGLQNGTLALALAGILFGPGPEMIPAATYSLIMFATALGFVAWTRRQPHGA